MRRLARNMDVQDFTQLPEFITLPKSRQGRKRKRENRKGEEKEKTIEGGKEEERGRGKAGRLK